MEQWWKTNLKKNIQSPFLAITINLTDNKWTLKLLLSYAFTLILSSHGIRPDAKNGCNFSGWCHFHSAVCSVRQLVLFSLLRQCPPLPFPVGMNQPDRDVTLVRYDKTHPLSISSGLSLAEFAVQLSLMTRKIALNIKNNSNLEP